MDIRSHLTRQMGIDSLTARHRLTRPQAKARTRQHLLEAAQKVFLRDGFGGASLDDIAEVAGYTRGAIYSNFSGKDDLFLALLEEHFTTAIGEAELALERAATPEQRVAALQEWHAAHHERERHFTVLFMEFWLYALRNPDVRERVRALERRTRGSVARLVQESLDSYGVDSPVSAHDIASIILALDSGLCGQAYVDQGAVPPEVFGMALMLLTEGVLASGRSRRPPAKRAARR